MTDTTIATTTATAPVAAVIRSITEVQTLVLALIAEQNEITVVSAEIVDVKFGDKRGKRVELILAGAGISTPTRRYFLRNNSAFSTAIGDSPVIMHAPKKARGNDNYQLNFGLNEGAVTFQAPKAAKAPRVLMTADAKKEARAAGKVAAKAAREAAAAEAAANAPASEPEVNAETTVLDSAEPSTIDTGVTAEVNEEVLEDA